LRGEDATEEEKLDDEDLPCTQHIRQPSAGGAAARFLFLPSPHLLLVVVLWERHWPLTVKKERVAKPMREHAFYV